MGLEWMADRTAYARENGYERKIAAVAYADSSVTAVYVDSSVDGHD